MDFKKSPPTHFDDLDDLDEEAAHKEIEELREGINYHDYLYYNEQRRDVIESVEWSLMPALQPVGCSG